jgi:hypothetical protein
MPMGRQEANINKLVLTLSQPTRIIVHTEQKEKSLFHQENTAPDCFGLNFILVLQTEKRVRYIWRRIPMLI